MQRILRDDQQLAIDHVRSAIGDFIKRSREPLAQYKDRPRLVLQAPTGFGKTVVAGATIESALARGRRVIFTVPRKDLVEQAKASFKLEGITEIGIIQADHEETDWSKPLQIASVQTLMRRAVKPIRSDSVLLTERPDALSIPKADLVLMDEIHMWFDFYGKWMLDQDWLNIPFIGLSATPWKIGLGAYFNKLIIASTIEKLIEQGSLAPFRVFAPDHPDLTGVRTVGDDYHEDDLSAAMQRGTLTADIVDTWLQRGEGRSTFVFCVNRAHAKNVQQQFLKKGVRAGYVDAYSDRQDKKTRDGGIIEGRETIQRKFETGEYKVICNVGVLTTGIDWDVRCLVIARPTKSEMLLVQMIGRGLRTAEGKDDCLILDHSDSTLRLGFVTDIHHEDLYSTRMEKKEKSDTIKLPKECPQCHFLKPPGVGKCPSCGHVGKPVDKTEVEAGELKELQRKKRDTFADKITKPQAFAELQGYAQERNFKPGWAANKFRQIFNVWPNHYKDVAPCEPSAQMLSWIKHDNIRWAKSRNNPVNQ